LEGSLGARPIPVLMPNAQVKADLPEAVFDP